MSSLSSARKAGTLAIESLVNDECGYSLRVKSWTSHYFSLRTWCTHWCTISRLAVFFTNCWWMDVVHSTVCAHRNRITAHRTHTDATFIGNSIFAYWLLHIYFVVHFEIFVVLPQNPMLISFFFQLSYISLYISHGPMQVTFLRALCYEEILGSF